MVDSPKKQHDVSRIVAEIRERGNCIVPSVISSEKADEARAVLERLLEDEISDETRAAKTQRVHGIAYKHPIFAEPLEKVCGQTILMLDDFSEQNGGTGFVPNSHVKGHMPPSEWNTQWPPEAEILTGTRGSALVFHGALWHTARPNRSDKARSALLGMYTRPFFLQMEDMLGQLERVEDPSDMVRQLMGARRHQQVIVGG